MMKNIQVIDSANNCKYNIYSATEEEFFLIFPNGADIEFIEDFIKRVRTKTAREVTENMWKRPVPKEEVQGIHGTLFYALKKEKKAFYPKKRFSDDKYGG
jgi:hypothetical protein